VSKNVSLCADGVGRRRGGGVEGGWQTQNVLVYLRLRFKCIFVSKLLNPFRFRIGYFIKLYSEFALIFFVVLSLLNPDFLQKSRGKSPDLPTLEAGENVGFFAL
jgi:hypothetical protein